MLLCGCRWRWRGRVLGFSKQAYYKWLKQPVSAREADEAHLIGVLHDLHEDDPEGGYRVLADDMADLGYRVSERRVWRLCHVAGIRSTITTRKRKHSPPGPPAHDDLVERQFRSDAPNRLWLVDITEHHTREGRLYLCAVKDVFSNKIVGYCIDSRMKARIAVNALEMAVTHRSNPRCVVVHSDRGSQGGFNRLSQHLDEKGGWRWLPRTGVRRPVTCPCRCVVSGVRIGHYGHRCAPLGAR